MGFGLRFREKVRQVGKKSSQPDKNGFIPTNYERVQLTYDEAVAFGDSLKTIRKRVADANLARTKMLKDLEGILTSKLPCIHEIDPVTGDHSTAEAAPEDHEQHYVHAGTLSQLARENESKMNVQFFAPIDKWIAEVDNFKGKMKILENLRLDLDGSRRDHINIENKIAKAEQKHVEVDSKYTAHIQSKDASVAGKRTAFEQYESQLYDELTNLIGESGMLHTALNRCMNLEIEIYANAMDPINSTTARLEKLGSTVNSANSTPASTPNLTPPGGVPPSERSFSSQGYPVGSVPPSYAQARAGYESRPGTQGSLPPVSDFRPSSAAPSVAATSVAGQSRPATGVAYPTEYPPAA